MGERFRSFSLVDRILDVEPAVRAQGSFLIPDTLDEFPPSLVGEAIGQLAAWVAMAEVDFAKRPVAGIAEEVRVHRDPLPGDRLELSVDIERCDAEAVVYGGRAVVDHQPIVELVRCLGPMLPMTEFDDPQDVEQRFEFLRGDGAIEGAFPGVLPPGLTPLDGDDPGRLTAELRVPSEAAFFTDHFPRRPVFPATLLLDAQIRLALMLGKRRKPTDSMRVRRISRMKQRSFVSPGERLSIEARWVSDRPDSATVALSAYAADKRIALARAELAVEEAR